VGGRLLVQNANPSTSCTPVWMPPAYQEVVVVVVVVVVVESEVPSRRLVEGCWDNGAKCGGDGVGRGGWSHSAVCVWGEESAAA
jgi:hypothetical protein